MSALEGFSLSLLQVSRQIYHEAALKPFQQTLFTFDFDDSQTREASYGLPAFMNALVPAQVKAITRLRLLSTGPACISYAKLSRLEGLKHLEIQLNLSFAHFDYTSRQLRHFVAEPVVVSLVKLNLKSSRVELGLNEPDYHGIKWLQREGKILKPPTIDDAKIFEDVLKRTENALLGTVS